MRENCDPIQVVVSSIHSRSLPSSLVDVGVHFPVDGRGDLLPYATATAVLNLHELRCIPWQIAGAFDVVFERRVAKNACYERMQPANNTD